MKSTITIFDLIKKVELYDEEAIDIITKAYNVANEAHLGQVRQSGEPYISHPLSVAYILASMNADSDTICAGLLHDTIEDTKITKEDIKKEFNEDVANLVDGVTKISKLNFSSATDMDLANTRKIITSITEDVRIIIIKIADRLHNMRTLEFKSEFKQKKISLETLELFVPLAYYIGAYNIKREMEDIALKYLKPELYKEIEEKRNSIVDKCQDSLEDMLEKISFMLEEKKIHNSMRIRIKNIYGIYKKMQDNYKISDIHDLLSIKVMVNSIEECYQVLGLVHSKYSPINEKFKDYIFNSKTNMYRSLHTTVFGENDKIVQIQIKTFEMDNIAENGLTAYWKINGEEKARDLMQEDLKKKYQFYKSLKEINKKFNDNEDFIKQVQSELFSNKIYVYTSKGEIKELPKGSTIIDFAYKIHSEVGNTLEKAKVNGIYVDLDYVLKNKDRVQIITNPLSNGPKKDWVDKAITTYAKRKIKEFNKIKDNN